MPLWGYPMVIKYYPFRIKNDPALPRRYVHGQPVWSKRANRFPVLVGAIALEEGFAVNHRKTRVMRSSTRQQVTGIVVNQKPNLARSHYDTLKATLHNCARFGATSQNRQGHADFRAHLAGRVAHVRQINSGHGTKLQAIFDRIRWDNEK